MSRVRLENVYAIVDFRGRKRGRERVGDYMPPNADKWGRITLLRVPTDGNHPAGHIAGIPGLLALGAAWRLLSLAANTPRPGYLVEWRSDGQTLQPITDERLAERMRITPLEWLPIAETLLRAQFLARIAIDIDPGPLLIDDHVAEWLTHQDAAPLFAAPVQSSSGHSATNKTNQKRNQTQSTPADGPPGTGKFSGPAVRPNMGASRSTQLRAQLCELAGANGATGQDHKLACCKIIDDYAREVLQAVGWDHATGGREARRALGSLWRKPDSQGRPPSAALRALRIAELCDLVDDIALRSDVANPVGYFVNRVKALQQKQSRAQDDEPATPHQLSQ